MRLFSAVASKHCTSLVLSRKRKSVTETQTDEMCQYAIISRLHSAGNALLNYKYPFFIMESRRIVCRINVFMFRL